MWLLNIPVPTLKMETSQLSTVVRRLDDDEYLVFSGRSAEQAL